jgi:tetratricopeptide (TPR) repeat protein
MKSLTTFFFAILLSWNAAYTQNNNDILTERDKKKIIDSTVHFVNEKYVFPEVAIQMESHLRKIQEEGFFDTISNPKDFAKVMTTELQSICHDKHLRLGYESPRLNNDEKTEDEQEIDMLLNQLNPDFHDSGIDRVEIFEGNIGYIRINHVMLTKDAKEALTSAFRILSNTFTIIIDVRNNGGGEPAYMQYCLAYFFDKPTHINSFYVRDTDELHEFRTVENIPGKKMTDVPLFVLTSRQTFSGGEGLAYNLQAQNRATIIGDTTGGGANPAMNWHLYKDFYILIPFGRAVNPITGTNWEGIGVLPDIPVQADKALDTALIHARLSALYYCNNRKEKIIKSYNQCLVKLDQAENLYKDSPRDAEKLIDSVLTNLLDTEVLDQSAVDRIGYKYLNKKKNQMAIGIFKVNVRKFPESAQVYDSLGEAYLESNNWELAKLNYEKAFKLDPESPSTIEALKTIQQKIK